MSSSHNHLLLTMNINYHFSIHYIWQIIQGPTQLNKYKF